MSLVWLELSEAELDPLIHNKLTPGRCDYCRLGSVAARGLRLPSMQLEDKREEWSEPRHAHLVFAVESCSECENRFFHPGIKPEDRPVPGALVSVLITLVAEWQDLECPNDDDGE